MICKFYFLEDNNCIIALKGCCASKHKSLELALFSTEILGCVSSILSFKKAVCTFILWFGPNKLTTTSFWHWGGNMFSGFFSYTERMQFCCKVSISFCGLYCRINIFSTASRPFCLYVLLFY